MAIVNMEGLHLGSPAPGFSGELEFSGTGASGNTEKYDLAAGTRLQWHQQKTTDFLLLDYRYGRVAGDTNTDKSFAHFRHIYETGPNLAWEVFVQAEQNEFTRMEFRGLGGAGARFGLGDKSPASARYLGVGAFYVSETLTKVPGLTDDGTERLWRANAYFVIKYKISDHAGFVSSTYYQPSLKDSGDYRLLETASLAVEITGKLLLKLSIEIVHDNEPPQAVESTDTSYRTGISYIF